MGPVVEPKKIKGATSVDGALREKSGGFLAAFAAFPKHAKFSGEMEDEGVILLMRAHVVTNIPWLLIGLILIIAPPLVYPWAINLELIPLLPSGLKTVLTLLWYLGVFAYIFLNFLYWYFNVYIVTNERVVDIDWYSLLHREMSLAQISKIQDVNAIQVGVLAGLFDYGLVTIQTAGEAPNFDFTNVPHPQLVVQKIQELMQAEEIQWEPNMP